MSYGQLQVLFLLTVYSFSIFGYKECNQFDFCIDHLVMTMYKIVSCVVEKGSFLYSMILDNNYPHLNLHFLILASDLD